MKRMTKKEIQQLVSMMEWYVSHGHNVPIGLLESYTKATGKQYDPKGTSKLIYKLINGHEYKK